MLWVEGEITLLRQRAACCRVVAEHVCPVALAAGAAVKRKRGDDAVYAATEMKAHARSDRVRYQDYASRYDLVAERWAERMRSREPRFASRSQKLFPVAPVEDPERERHPVGFVDEIVAPVYAAAAKLRGVASYLLRCEVEWAVRGAAYRMGDGQAERLFAEVETAVCEDFRRYLGYEERCKDIAGAWAESVLPRDPEWSEVSQSGGAKV
jgi:hypothetical protein